MKIIPSTYWILWEIMIMASYMADDEALLVFLKVQYPDQSSFQTSATFGAEALTLAVGIGQGVGEEHDAGRVGAMPQA